MVRRWAIHAGLSVLALIALGTVLRAQQNNPDVRPLLDRLDRLERDVNLLQRQVYRGSSGGAPVPSPSAGGESALNTELRMGRLEDQMRTLTGQFEETNYKLEQLRQRLDKLQSDIEFRFSQLEHPGAAPAGAQTAASDSGQSSQSASPAVLGGQTPARGQGAGANPSQPASQSGVLGTIVVPPGAAKAGDAAAAPAPTPPKPDTMAAATSGTPQEQYNYAFGLLRQSRYDEAEQALRGFVQRNPKDALAGNAQYWLGETYYVRKDYNNAAAVFAEGYEKYPKNAKAPDNLLKLGMSLANLGQKENACRAFSRLDRDYPTAASEIKDRSAAEKKRLGCGA